jgi:hypothetical protein
LTPAFVFGITKLGGARFQRLRPPADKNKIQDQEEVRERGIEGRRNRVRGRYYQRKRGRGQRGREVERGEREG